MSIFSEKFDFSINNFSPMTWKTFNPRPRPKSVIFSTQKLNLDSTEKVHR